MRDKMTKEQKAALGNRYSWTFSPENSQYTVWDNWKGRPLGRYRFRWQAAARIASLRCEA